MNFMEGKMNPKYTLLSVALLISIPCLAQAIQVKGVDIAPQVTQSVSKQTLVLNGTGVRTKFVFSIYVGALYLTKQSKDPGQIMSNPDSKRIYMHFLYDRIEKEKMVNGWLSGFEDNMDEVSFGKLKPKIDQFNQAFGDTVKGDVVIIDFIDDKETIVNINQQEKTRIPGGDFQKALLSVWLGKEPVDNDLKKAMLGIKEDE